MGGSRESPARVGWPHLVVVALAALVAALRLANIWWPAAAESLAYDSMQAHLVPRSRPTGQLVVVELDDHSLEEIGERWPIRRATWARFFRRLSACEPAVIAADVVFDQPAPAEDLELGEMALQRLNELGLTETDAGRQLAGELGDELVRRNEDRLLAEAIAEAGTVVLGALLYADRVVRLEQDPAQPPSHPLRVVLPTRLRLSGNGLVTSQAQLAVSARANALLNVLVDADGVVRRYPYAASWGGNAYSSLALAAVTLAHPEAATAYHHQLANSDRGAPLLRFPALEALDRVRFSDLLLGSDCSPELRRALGGRIVLVGVTASGVFERLAVPTGPSVAGVDIHAAAVEDLLRGDYVRSEGSPAWLGLVLAIALLGGYAVASVRVARFGLVAALGLVAAAAYLAAVALLYARIGWLLPILPVPVGVVALAAVEGGRRARRIQQRQRALREQERLNEAYGEFLSTVSHELRTPLTSIRGSLELAQAGAAGRLPPELGELIDVARSNTRRLGRLVDDVLDLQKMDAGQLKLEPAPCDLRAVLREAVEANRGFAEAFEIGLALEEPADPLPVVADSDRIVQVLTNLISNAVKFSPAHGEVRVWGELRGKGAVRAWVEDRGPGIPPGLRDRVFERFAQARGAHPVKGTGLGLSIAKAIVERHGGSIGFETDAARGTKFFFELPAGGRPASAPDS